MSPEINSSFFGILESITLTKNGVWLSNGEEILHEGTVRAFSRNVFRTQDGFEIHLGPEKKSIQVEDTLYFVVALNGSPSAGFVLTLNDGRNEALDPTTLSYQPDRLTCRVSGQPSFPSEGAKFLSQAYYQLLNYLEKSNSGFYLTIQSKTILLGHD
jgi:hypothetical protein